MAISFLDNIAIKKKAPNVERDLFENISEMVNFSQNYLPDVFECNVKDTGKRYRYNVSNTDDPVTGKWREVGGGSSDLSNYYNKTETNDIVQAVKDIAEANQTNIGTIASLAVDTWTDLVTAINDLHSSFMASMTYSNKKMILAYRNGSSVEIDVSAIITDTNIEEFKNVGIDIDTLEDGQLLGYDTTTNKWTNKTIDLAKVLEDAKKYTDDEITKSEQENAIGCDEKPSKVGDTITYIQNGETKTTTDTSKWFYYKSGVGVAQTRWINDIEYNIDLGAINLDNFVDKNTDIVSVFEENPADLSKIPNLKYMNAMRIVLTTALGKKINTTDIVDALNSEATDKPLSANQGKVLDEKITELSEVVDGKLAIQQDETFAGKVVSVNELGKLVFVDGGGSADKVAYENENYPLWTTVKKAIDGIVAKIDYKKPEITSFTMTPSTTVYEVGESVSSIKFDWATNKDITTQTLTDCALADENVRTVTYNTPITSNKTFELKIGDGQNTASKTLSIAFRNKVYWGSASIPSDYNSAFILGLSKNQFATSKNGDYAMVVGNGEYGYIAVPTSFNMKAECYIGGFLTDLVKEATISFTNAHGGITTYDIFRTGKSGLGSLTMTIK